MVETNPPKPEIDFEQILEQLNQADEFAFAPEDKIDAFRREVDFILNTLGFPGAWVSDQSAIGDFFLTPTDLSELEKRLGFTVKADDYLWQVAEKIRHRSNP